MLTHLKVLMAVIGIGVLSALGDLHSDGYEPNQTTVRHSKNTFEAAESNGPSLVQQNETTAEQPQKRDRGKFERMWKVCCNIVLLSCLFTILIHVADQKDVSVTISVIAALNFGKLIIRNYQDPYRWWMSSLCYMCLYEMVLPLLGISAEALNVLKRKVEPERKQTQIEVVQERQQTEMAIKEAEEKVRKARANVRAIRAVLQKAQEQAKDSQSPRKAKANQAKIKEAEASEKEAIARYKKAKETVMALQEGATTTNVDAKERADITERAAIAVTNRQIKVATEKNGDLAQQVAKAKTEAAEWQ